MTTTQALTVTLMAKDLLTKPVEQAEQVVAKSAKHMQDAFKSLENVGRSLGKIGDITSGLSLFSVNMAANFDDSMRKVASVVGEPIEAMGELSAKAQEMGKTTKFHATEAADAMYYMGLAGWDDQAILEGLNGVMMLSAASGVDLATTSDIVTDALTAFGLSAKDADHFVDVLAQTSRNSNTNVLMD